MKICIPTETGEGKKAQVYSHFGSAPFFTIYDTANGEVEVVANTEEHHSHGTCHPMHALAGKGIEAVVAGGAGKRAVQKLNEDKIKVFRAVSGTVEEVAAQFAGGGMEEVTAESACTQQHGCH